MVIYVLLIIAFLICSAFFSGMEAAIFSISRFRVKTLGFENQKGARLLEKVKKESSKTLAALLLSNLLANTGASSVAAIILVQIVAKYQFNTTLSFVTEFILMTSILLVCSEITPKVVAYSNAEFFALRFSGIVNVISTVFSPVSRFAEFLIRRISPSKPSRIISESEIRFMIKEAKQFNILDESEERIGYQILMFGKKKVSEIMTPRMRVVGINIDDELKEAMKLIKETRHSRIVVYDKSGDVGGVIYAKDLFVNSSLANLKVSDLVREPYFVPETKQLDTLLAEFRKKGIHFSLVVDEFGDFKGVVTLEDILETLFGEIIDEYDSAADLPYHKLAPDLYIFDGDISIAEINQVFKTHVFSEESERLAAYILRYLGRFPRENETIHVGNFEIMVSEIRNRVIRKVLVKKL